MSSNFQVAWLPQPQPQPLRVTITKSTILISRCLIQPYLPKILNRQPRLSCLHRRLQHHVTSDFPSLKLLMMRRILEVNASTLNGDSSIKSLNAHCSSHMGDPGSSFSTQWQRNSKPPFCTYNAAQVMALGCNVRHRCTRHCQCCGLCSMPTSFLVGTMLVSFRIVP